MERSRFCAKCVPFAPQTARASHNPKSNRSSSDNTLDQRFAIIIRDGPPTTDHRPPVTDLH
jgi:hypothetical protein